MPQIFHRSTNTLAKLSIFGSIFVLLFITWAVAEINRSSWNTGAFDEREQPDQFSHRHHTGDARERVRARGPARPVFAQAPHGRRRYRLPLLPHVGRNLLQRGAAADQD